MNKVKKLAVSFLCVFAILTTIIPTGHTQVYANDVDVIVSTEEKLIEEINNAVDGVEKHIQIDTPIQVTKMIKIPINKNILISSKNNNSSTLTRNAGYTNHILVVEEGAKLKTNNIILDGEKDIRTDIMGSLVFVKGEYTVEEGTILQNNKVSVINSDENYQNYIVGAGVYATGENASIKVNGGLITKNESLSYKLTDDPYLYVGTYGGGGITTRESAKLTMSGGTISYNTSEGAGGGVHASGETILSGTTIDNNYSDTSGGGIAIYGWAEEDSASFVMSGGSVTNNSTRADGFGGGVYVSQTALLKESNMHWTSKNYTDYQILPVEVTGGLVQNNSANVGGGFYFNYSTATLGGSLIVDNNKASFHGGGIALGVKDNSISTMFWGANGNFAITGGMYSNNYAKNSGGALYYVEMYKEMAPNGLVITGGTFKGNIADYSGGGIYASDEMKIKIEGTKENPIIVEDNTAQYNGGGISLRKTSYDNYSGTDYCQAYLKDIIVRNNKVTSTNTDYDEYGDGGGIALKGFIDVILDDVTITKNTATGEGAAVMAIGYSWPLHNQIIIKGDTKIGVDESDNGIYLLTHLLIDRRSGTPIITDNYISYIQVDGVLGDNARVNIEGAEDMVGIEIGSEYVEVSATVDSLIGRLIAEKLDLNETFTDIEANKFFYQGEELYVNVNEDATSQLILGRRSSEIGEISIIDNYHDDDGIVVIHRTGETGENTGMYPSGYPSEYELELTIDGNNITDEQLSKVTWEVEVAGEFPELIEYAVIEDGTNTVVAKKSGVVKLTATYNGNTASIYVVIPGDVTRDGRVNTADAMNIQRYSADRNHDITYLGKVDEFTLLLADLDGANGVNTADKVIIQKMVSKTISPSN
ncbi:hypothetical protein [Breznakia pachnodae]|uniref:Outer membrane repeat protein n=1 Tax=Breznakia pachnodae TaxID=265178 RepID=A0ABU0E7Q2_9FIRM|nr:hypothetical protein [Breznakia pachnodae]MDQ0362738.1 putative outer membrane repeat protein [Breznakia pachnodae]